MSTKLKINIILLAIMAVSTGYFLHLIDMQERIITQYEAQQYERKHPSGKIKIYDIFPEDAIQYEQIINAKQSVKELYRYIISSNIFLIVSIFVISKSINKRKDVD